MFPHNVEEQFPVGDRLATKIQSPSCAVTVSFTAVYNVNKLRPDVFLDILARNPVYWDEAEELVETLLTKARKYLPEDRVGILAEAYTFAEKAHRGQVRLSGEPFLEHPYQTALFLTDLKLDPNTLAAALLHDVMEDCGVTVEELETRFGPEVAKLVNGVTKLTKTELESVDRPSNANSGSEEDLARAASIRKMLMSMADDIRVVLIKLADRLHNMKTLKALPSDRRTVVAQETLDIYAPLAHRIGIWEMKWRLEDLSFRHLNPKAYKQISRLLRAKRNEREEYIHRVKAILQCKLESEGIRATVTGRPKHIYSIHKKIQKYASQNRELGEIYDLFALRVLAQNIRDCYAALGVVHTEWRPLPGQFDDYVANPKDNLYQSLHTTVLCENASPVEVQIRTYAMHRVAEYGVSAHWLYKEREPSDVRFDQKMMWLRQLLDWQGDVGGPEEFVESFKTDIFHSQVFVYTPKREIKELPVGATPLDFAYRIHTDVGHRCVGAKVNDRLVPLHYNLQNGDTVQIITSSTVSGPSLDWISLNPRTVRTSSARAKIRQWFNRQERKINIQQGEDLFRRQVHRLDLGMEDVDVARRLDFGTLEELFASLGDGTITITQLVAKLSPQKILLGNESENIDTPAGSTTGTQVLGAGDLTVGIAHCCNPIHGDEIIGYVTRSSGVTVHRNTCANVLQDTEMERLVPITWGVYQELSPARIQIKAWDRVGLLGDITSLVSEERVNIAACVSEEDGDFSIVSLTVFTSGVDQLNRLFSKLEGVKGAIVVSSLES